jgi:lysozyme
MILPLAKPKQSKEQTFDLIRSVSAPVALLGVRGYYKQMGRNPLGNDIDIYDDALFLWSESGYMSFNANTDPSITRPRVATLKSGIWQYRLGTHNITKAKSQQYPALVQAAPVTVVRHGAGEDTGWFGINIHRGSRTTTSSLGCVTIPPSQWGEFFTVVKGEMNRAKVNRIPLVLIENI